MTIDAWLSAIDTNIVQPFIYLMLALAAIFFVWGVFQFVMSSDNPEGKEKGKRHMVWGSIGLAIMISVESLIELIKNTVT